MPYALALRLDAALAARVEAMQRGLDAGSPQTRPAYPPHLTLALYQDDIPIDTMLSLLPDVVEEWDALRISLAGLGVFPADGVIWAAPVVTAALLDRHARLHAALGDFLCHPDYRPGSWMPHVTLNEHGRPSPDDVLRAIIPLWTGPIVGRGDRLELVRFHPVELLWSHLLA
jgi:2'-5' RNA ligase